MNQNDDLQKYVFHENTNMKTTESHIQEPCKIPESNFKESTSNHYSSNHPVKIKATTFTSQVEVNTRIKMELWIEVPQNPSSEIFKEQMKIHMKICLRKCK